ncbi:MAG: hypothetical protein FWD34_02365 [Oscillospiraceae bacterium]|nr:hypothetical protein [Oscillospiraceae bacterium]
MQIEKLHQDHLIEIINNLPLDERVAVYFYYIEKLDVSEIAEQLAITPDEVGERLTRARAKIKEDSEKENNPMGAIFITGGLIAFIPILKNAMKTSDFPAEVMNIISRLNALSAPATVTATSAIPIKAIAAVIAGVVVTGGLVAGVVLANVGGDVNIAPSNNPYDDEPRRTTVGDAHPGVPSDNPDTNPENEPGSSTRPAQVGDIIQFGDYTWIVVEVSHDQIYIVSENIVSLNNYHTVNEYAVSEGESLETYLNGEFYSSFSQADRARILSHIMIPSFSDFEMYLTATKIANYEGQPHWWWIWSRYVQSIDGSFYASCVLEDGTFLEIGRAVTDYGGVRPMMWISKTQADNFTTH